MLKENYKISSLVISVAGILMIWQKKNMKQLLPKVKWIIIITPLPYCYFMLNP